MNKYKVTFKRIEEFYQSIIVESINEEKARELADQLSIKGEIEFDYLKESDIIEEYILEIENILITN